MEKPKYRQKRDGSIHGLALQSGKILSLSVLGSLGIAFADNAVTNYEHLLTAYDDPVKEINSASSTIDGIKTKSTAFTNAAKKVQSSLKALSVSVNLKFLPAPTLEPQYDKSKTAITLSAGYTNELKTSDYKISVKTIDASNVTKSITVNGNSKANTIFLATATTLLMDSAAKMWFSVLTATTKLTAATATIQFSAMRVPNGSITLKDAKDKTITIHGYYTNGKYVGYLNFSSSSADLVSSADLAEDFWFTDTASPDVSDLDSLMNELPTENVSVDDFLTGTADNSFKLLDGVTFAQASDKK